MVMRIKIMDVDNTNEIKHQNNIINIWDENGERKKRIEER
jgi:hypothetical protein